MPDLRRASRHETNAISADRSAPAGQVAADDQDGGGPDSGPGPRVTVIVPACGQGNRIAVVLDRLFEAVRLPCEVLVVTGSAADPTVVAARRYARQEHRLRCLISGYEPGSADAIRFGLDAARAAVFVVAMADGRDDPRLIDPMVLLVERGCAMAAASRYMRGGQLAGAPRLRGIASRAACRSLRLLSRAGTTDATNSFKACSTAFARRAGIDSRNGSEVGIELTAKARRLRLPVAEIPTIAVDHLTGVPAAQIFRWLPGYLRWYGFCFGPRLTIAQVRAKAGARLARQPPSGLPA